MRSSLACRRRRRQISRPFPTWCRSDRPKGGAYRRTAGHCPPQDWNLGWMCLACGAKAGRYRPGVLDVQLGGEGAERVASSHLEFPQHRGRRRFGLGTGKNSHTPNLRISVTAHLRDEFAPLGHPPLMAGHPGGTEGGAAAGLTRGRSLAVSVVGTLPVQSCQPATSATVCKVGAKACARLQKDTPSGPLP